MKVYDIDQGSDEWALVRLGKVTASESHNILTPEFKTRTGDTFNSYLYAKIAEVWRNAPLPGFSSWATEQGTLREDEAWKWLSLEKDFKIKRVGFIESDDKRCGCSPDGLISEDNGLEIKAPECVNHVRYLAEGILPKQYVTQVHFSMFVTGRPKWTFLSYRREFPKFVLEVKRDEAICEKIQAALSQFYTAFDAAMTRMKQLERTI